MKTDEAFHNLDEMKDRIQDIVSILADFKRRRDPNVSREEYMDRLRSYCARFYGYLHPSVLTVATTRIW